MRSASSFPGGTYSHVFYVADATIRGPLANGELHIAFSRPTSSACFRSAATTRA